MSVSRVTENPRWILISHLLTLSLCPSHPSSLPLSLTFLYPLSDRSLAEGKRALSSIFPSQWFHHLILSFEHPLPPISLKPNWWTGHHPPKNATQKSQISPPPMKPSALVSRSVAAGLEKTSQARNSSSRGGVWQTCASLLVFF